MKLTRIGFVIKHHQPEASALAHDLAMLVLAAKRDALFCTESELVSRSLVDQLKASGKAGLARRVKTVPKGKLQERAQLIVVLGGDGTFLSIARQMKKKSIPIMGVNMGQLGFLTEIKKSEAHATLTRLLKGEKMPLGRRCILEVSLKRGNRVVFEGSVVNDAVIAKGAIARIIELDVAVNGKWVHSVRADGIIVATPTGSTAYSLAAGGPIVEPSLPALILTPICPHSLTQRPLMIQDRSTLQIRLKQRPGHVVLTLDGQEFVDLHEEDVVTVRRSKRRELLLISSPTRDYFGLLREKLKFGVRE